MAKRHFHTFDALRFFAFFKVFLLHLPILAFPWFVIFKAGGGIGVQFFFVLSGFLITYLLLEEKEKFNKPDLKKYFIRRILRIWPLYYVILIVAGTLSFLVARLGVEFNPQGYAPSWLHSIFFLENYKMMATGKFPQLTPLSVTWSVCIEEHFYILWGLVFYFLRSGAILRFLWIGVIAGPLFRIFYFDHGWTDLDLFSNLDLFAIGGLVSYDLRYGKTIRKISVSPKLYRAVWIVITIAATFIFPNMTIAGYQIWGPTALAILFAGLISVFLDPERSIGVSESSPLTMLGKYTYGFYLTHVIVILGTTYVFDRLGFSILEADPVRAILYFVVTFTLCFVVARITYELIERPFLRMKKYFYPGK